MAFSVKGIKFLVYFLCSTSSFYYLFLMATIIDLIPEPSYSPRDEQKKKNKLMGKFIYLIQSQLKKQKYGKTKLSLYENTQSFLKMTLVLPSDKNIKIAISVKVALKSKEIYFQLLLSWNQIFTTLKTTRLFISILPQILLSNYFMTSETIVVNPCNRFLSLKQIIQQNDLYSLTLVNLLRYFNQRIYRLKATVNEMLFPFLIICNQIPTEFSNNQLIESQQQIINYINHCNLNLVQQVQNQFTSSYKFDNQYLIRNYIPLSFFEKCNFHFFSFFQPNSKAVKSFALDAEKIGGLLKLPQPRVKQEGENKQIFNYIKVENEKEISKKKMGRSGGLSEIYCTKLAFEYQKSYYNDQIEVNKVKLRKIFAFKIQKIKTSAHTQTLKHQKQIVQNFFSGFSGYFIKYYVTKQSTCPLKNQLLMDFLYNYLTIFVYSKIHKNSFNLTTKLNILSGIGNGLRFLEQKKIVHMDLTPNNIMIGNDFIPKIIDFGSAYCEQLKQKNYQRGYTLPFCPPEVFLKSHFTKKQDMFSFGMMIYYLVFGKYPFQMSQKLVQVYKKKSYMKKMFIIPQSFSHTGNFIVLALLFRFIQKCLNVDERSRPESNWSVIILKQINSLMKDYLLD